MKVFWVILLVLLALTACTTVDDTKIRDIRYDPASFADQEIIVVDLMSQEIASGDSRDHFNYYLKDFESNKLRIMCPRYQFSHHNKYQVTGTLVYNNITKEYFLRCTEPPIKR